RALQILEDVAATAPEDARVMARDHRVVGPDRAVHGPADPNLRGGQVERPFDALSIAPEEPRHARKRYVNPRVSTSSAGFWDRLRAQCFAIRYQPRMVSERHVRGVWHP